MYTLQVFLRLRYMEKNSTNKLESSHAEKSFQITITITITIHYSYRIKLTLYLFLMF